MTNHAAASDDSTSPRTATVDSCSAFIDCSKWRRWVSVSSPPAAIARISFAVAPVSFRAPRSCFAASRSASTIAASQPDFAKASTSRLMPRSPGSAESTVAASVAAAIRWAGTYEIRLRNNQTAATGNDFGLDSIYFGLASAAPSAVPGTGLAAIGTLGLAGLARRRRR